MSYGYGEKRQVNRFFCAGEISTITFTPDAKFGPYGAFHLHLTNTSEVTCTRCPAGDGRIKLIS
jgi:hypothetical protein